MKTAIEMHDSECLAVEQNASGQGFVLLEAYVHRSEGEPGWSAGEGGTQRIRVLIEDMVVEGELGELPAYIYEGSLTVGGSTQDNMVPFPSAYTDIVRLSMMLSENARVVIVSGSGVSIQPEGEFTFVEHFPLS